jgi:hypothetical protein
MAHRLKQVEVEHTLMPVGVVRIPMLAEGARTQRQVGAVRE